MPVKCALFFRELGRASQFEDGGGATDVQDRGGMFTQVHCATSARINSKRTPFVLA